MTNLGKRLITWFVGLAVVGGGFTFCLKLYDFIKTASRGDLPGFAFATVVSYFIVTLGFLCLALWAFLSGHYHDIEEPKYRLLETESEIDRQEAERALAARPRTAP
jgi:nitrogen fixation-related uncharacterized protein